MKVIVCSTLVVFVAFGQTSGQLPPLPSDIRVWNAAYGLLAGAIKSGTFDVKGVRRTLDGGGEADLVFHRFDSTIGFGGPYDGDGTATIARYSDGYYLTRVNWGVDRYVSGKTKLEPGSPDGKPTLADLMVAIKISKIDVVRTMLDSGVPINGKQNGFSPLGFACRDEEVAIARLLLDRGANPNLLQGPPDKPVTILELAFLGGNPEIVKLVIAKGANPNAKLTNGKTPLEFLQANPENAPVIQLLKAAGAH